MAKKGLNGQLNMFDLFGFDPDGEVEMVSLMPEDDLVIQDEAIVVVEEEKATPVEPEPIPKPIPKPKAKPVVSKETTTSGLGNGEVVMSRCFSNANGEEAVVAYVNYNKVYVFEPEEEPVMYLFEDSKSAVDFYIEKLEIISKIPNMQEIAVKPRVCNCKIINYEKKLS